MARRGITILYVLIGLALVLSSALVINSFGLISFRSGEFQTSKNYALSLVDYNLDLAHDLGIPKNNTKVNLAHKRLQIAINNSATLEELYHLILTDMRNFEQAIREEAEFQLTNWLEWVVNQDPNLNQLETSTDLKISFITDQHVAIEGGDFLDEATVEKITTYRLPGALRLQTVTISVEVVDGYVMTRIKEPQMEQDPIQHMQNQYRFLEQEYENLRAMAGYSELIGPGLVIYLMDAEDDLIFDQTNIIHDVDVQEIVHSLYASGAMGITVGERRLVTNTSIRCVGGPILVNYEPIPVKPLVIKAVGDPERILTYLEPLLDNYSNQRKLRVEVSIEVELRLPAHPLR